MTRKWTIESDAGDGINGTSYDNLDSAKNAVMAIMSPDGDWDEVPGDPDSPENAWEYWAYDDARDPANAGDPDARIEYSLVF